MIEEVRMTDLCPMCRTQLADGSQFCHKCGVPLGDQPPRASGGRGVVLARWLIALTLGVYVGGWLGCWASAEIGLGFGLVNLALCVVMIGLGLLTGYAWAWYLGIAHCALFGLLFLLVVINRWGPPDAQGPFIGIGFVYMAITTPLTFRAWRSAPVKRHPMMCVKCGYLLYGLTQPRCPECGTPFDPKLLAGPPSLRQGPVAGP
jgi:hypothetical protein